MKIEKLLTVILLLTASSAQTQILSVARSHDDQVVVTLMDSLCPVYKFDMSGNSVWGFHSPGSGPTSEWYQAIAETSDSGFALGAYYHDSHIPTTGNYLVKINSIGDTMWSKIFQLNAGFNMIRETMDHGLLLANWPGYITKTDSAGNPQWYYFYMPAMSGENDIYDFRQLPDSSYIICGSTFHHPPVSETFSILWKLDKNGNKQWINEYTDGSIENIQVLNNGFLMGMILYYGLNDSLCIYKTDANGSLQWVQSFSYPGVHITGSAFHSIALSDSTYIFYYSNSMDNKSVVFKTDILGSLIWQREVMFQIGGIVSSGSGFKIAGWSQGHLEITTMDSLGNSAGCATACNYSFRSIHLFQQQAQGQSTTSNLTGAIPTRSFTPSISAADINCSLINGIETNKTNGDNISIYPNPSGNKFQISGYHASGNSQLLIYTFSGQVIYSQKIAEMETIEISHSLPDGIYLLALRNDQGLVSEVFVVGHQ